MKKTILKVAALVLVAGSTVLTSCKKDDTTAPIITLKGDAATSINLHDTYTDAGATASDDKDGDITTTIVVGGLPNIDQCGTYTVTYNVNDKAGNAATQVTRVVTVKSDNLAGTYDVSDDVTISGTMTTYTYNLGVNQSSTGADAIIFPTNFGGFATGPVNATVNGSTITIPSQTVNTASGSVTVYGTGAYSVTGTGTVGAKIVTIDYTASAGLGSGHATFSNKQ